jgi:stage V sporulation protein AB
LSRRCVSYSSTRLSVTGVFTGALIVSLTEILDFIPILDRRIKIKKGISLLVYAIAAGKMVGALYYWLYPEIIKMILSE